MSDLEKLKAICAGATPGPWKVTDNRVQYLTESWDGPGKYWADLGYNDSVRDGQRFHTLDATHVATFNPSLCLAMLECLEAAQGMRDILLVNRDDVTVQPYDTKRAALEEMMRGGWDECSKKKQRL